MPVFIKDELKVHPIVAVCMCELVHCCAGIGPSCLVFSGKNIMYTFHLLGVQVAIH